jgi:hypothetical protein
LKTGSRLDGINLCQKESSGILNFGAFDWCFIIQKRLFFVWHFRLTLSYGKETLILKEFAICNHIPDYSRRFKN